VFVFVQSPGATLRCDHSWAAWEEPCGLPCRPLRCCSCLQCVISVTVSWVGVLGISNDELTYLDSGREQGGERTAFCALSFASSLDSAGLFTGRIKKLICNSSKQKVS
jgi:hypothetical protein